MKKILVLLFSLCAVSAHGLVISEVMSNPTGDDSGREWFEIYNNESAPVDIATLTISIKGGTAVPVTPLSGGTVLAPGAYAVIGSTVSGQTKFLQDYPNYNGVLLKSSISLVNTGVTSIDIKLNGTTVDSLSSYAAAKEGYTYALIQGGFLQATPTPGEVNIASQTTSDTSGGQTATSTSQQSVQQQTAPSPDVVIYLPFEKTVVAGAPTMFSSYGTNKAGTALDDLSFVWAFGDGGQATGSSTMYTYAYPGRYVALVEAHNSHVYGVGIMKVRVVSPDIGIAKIDSGKYGTYVDITNPNTYDLDLSQWRLLINNQGFPFPKNTILGAGATTRFSGAAMGFASTSPTAVQSIKVLFPNQEEVVNFVPSLPQVAGTSTQSTSVSPPVAKTLPKVSLKKVPTSQVATSSATSTLATSSTIVKPATKDTRIASFLKSLFGK